nr:glycine cleavage system protein GcvH [Parvimonas sp.]
MNVVIVKFLGGIFKMKVEKGLLYTKDHDWVKVEGNVATIGLADYAQDHLGDIVYVELPEVDDEAEAGESLASVESVKAASDIVAPVSGKVIEVNEVLDDEPGEINKDPYGAWVCKIEMSNPAELEELMNDADYEASL